MTTATKDEQTTVPAAPAVENQALQPSAPAGSHMPATTAPKVPVRMGVAPSTIEEAWRMAGIFADSEMVPKQYRNVYQGGKLAVDRRSDVVVAMQYGIELGFPPMAALQSIAVINGRPSVWGDGFLALIMSSPLYRDHHEYYLVDGAKQDTIDIEDMKKDDTKAVCTFWRMGKPIPVTRSFSVGQAKKARLWTKEGPWEDYPDRQLAMRARGFAGRDAFPDLLRGIKTAEEVRDAPVDDIPIDVPTSHEPIQPRRASEARASSSQHAPAISPASDPPEPTVAPGNAESSAPASAPATGQEMRGLLIVNTSFVKPKSGEPFYEVVAKTSTGHAQTFLTRDERVYKEAASFEGTDHAVVVGFHEATKESAKVLVLDRLAIYEENGETEHAGPLFD